MSDQRSTARQIVDALGLTPIEVEMSKTYHLLRKEVEKYTC